MSIKGQRKTQKGGHHITKEHQTKTKNTRHQKNIRHQKDIRHQKKSYTTNRIPDTKKEAVPQSDQKKDTLTHKTHWYFKKRTSV